MGKAMAAQIGLGRQAVVKTEEIKGAVFEREDLGDVNALAESIKQGQLQEIVVRPLDDGYQIIAGYRRYVAAKKAGIKELRAFVVEVDEVNAAFLSLKSDIDNKTLTDYEIALRLKALKEKGLKPAEIARRLNKSKAWVSQYLSILDQPKEVQEAVKQGKMGIKHVRELKKLSEQEKVEIAKRMSDDEKITADQIREIKEKARERKEKEKEIEELRKKVEHYQNKLKEVEEAKQRVKEISKEIESLEKKIAEIDKKAAEITVEHNGTKVDMQEIISTVNFLETDYAQKQSMLAQLREQKRQALEEFEQINVTDAQIMEARAEYKRWSEEVEKLEKKLKQARQKRDSAYEKLTTLERQKRERERKKNEIESLTGSIKNIEKDIAIIERRYAYALMNFDEIKKLAENAKELLEERRKVKEKLENLRAEKGRLQGLISNEVTFKTKLEENRKKLEELKKN